MLAIFAREAQRLREAIGRLAGLLDRGLDALLHHLLGGLSSILAQLGHLGHAVAGGIGELLALLGAAIEAGFNRLGVAGILAVLLAVIRVLAVRHFGGPSNMYQDIHHC